MDVQKILQIFNSAQASKNQGDFEKSSKLYEEILQITDRLPEVYFNLAFVYMNLDKQTNAIECLENYLKAEPNDEEAQYFLAAAYFKNKEYSKGFPFFESRISKKHAVHTQLHLFGQNFEHLPFWQGEDLTDKTIYVYYEAGLGDTLMYFRFIDLLTKKCKKVYFKPQVQLLPLFAENKGNAHIIMKLDENIAKKCDYQCPIMSLPYHLGLNDETIFANNKKFLHATKRKISEYKNKFFQNNKLKIGIKWQGNTFIGGERAMNAESFAKIFEIPNSQIYSIQVMEGYEQIHKLQEKYNLIDLGSTFKDFSDTAGAIENLDIIICNDTSVGHLAGAMGKQCYMVLPKHYDWRWHMNISKCDWYENIKLYRQKNEWKEVINRIYKDIMSLNIKKQ